MNDYPVSAGDCDLYINDKIFDDSLISYNRLVENNICNSCPLNDSCTLLHNECSFYIDVSNIIYMNKFIIDIYSRGLVDVSYQLYTPLSDIYGVLLSEHFISNMNNILSGELTYLFNTSNYELSM